jgi:hypothetical protein
MNWDRIVLCAKDLLGVVLVLRLLQLQLHGVYRVFAVFVLYECLGSSVVLFQSALTSRGVDYEWEWLVLSAVGWVITLWMVYAVLEAVLERLPGILKFSRRFLNYTFLAAVIVALITAKAELSGNTVPSGKSALESAVVVGMALERVIATVVLLVLLAIICFVLWFPVKLPRNLVVFSLGLVVYFSCRNVLMLAQEFLAVEAARAAAVASMLVLGGCFAYWGVCLSRAGEAAELRLGHGWRSGDQQRLMDQLEAMNAALLRGARR